MSEMFNANKQDRNQPFSFLNNSEVAGAQAGDQSAAVKPAFPAGLGPGQKVGNPVEEQAIQSLGLWVASGRNGRQPIMPTIERF